MAIKPEAIGAGGPAIPARPLVVSRARTARRIVVDRWSSRLVVLGGIIIIASILAILFVIGAEVYPLFKKPTSAWLGTYRAAAGGPPARGAPLGVDEYREVAHRITAAGVVEFVALKGNNRSLATIPVTGLDGARITGVAALGKASYLIGTSDGRVIPADMKSGVVFADGKRTVTPEPVFGQPSVLDPRGKRPILRLAAAMPASGHLTVAQISPTELVVQAVMEKKALVGGARREESLQGLSVPGPGEITALALDGRAEDLFIGMSAGQVLHYDMRAREKPRLAETVGPVAGSGGVSITALGFLIGDRTLVVGDRSGHVSSWQVIPPPSGGEPRLTRIYEFERHPGAVVAISGSKRDKGFATADTTGVVRLHYGTSGQTLLSMKADHGDVDSVVFAPKADGLLAVDRQGTVTHWQVDNPHPEITLKTVFGKVWYEGYPQPEYVWQSTGGTDDFEAKLSLTPLLYGTLKGTFYALLFAVPLALLAATYVSEFMHPAVKAYVKPVVEVM
ncbi:MAG: ABC transporter permease subunit, partial [Candidatus Rokuibacteriota bacterium]